MATVMTIDLRGQSPYYTLTKDADRIVYQTVGSGVLPGTMTAYNYSENSLDELRSEILSDIRGDSAGPLMVPKIAPLNRSVYDNIVASAQRQTDPAIRAEWMYIAGLEWRYASDMQVAQQVVHTAIYEGADWLDVAGSVAYNIAKQERGRLAQAAVDRYNSALPLGSNWPPKVYSLAWGM